MSNKKKLTEAFGVKPNKGEKIANVKDYDVFQDKSLLDSLRRSNVRAIY